MVEPPHLVCEGRLGIMGAGLGVKHVSQDFITASTLVSHDKYHGTFAPGGFEEPASAPSGDDARYHQVHESGDESRASAWGHGLEKWSYLSCRAARAGERCAVGSSGMKVKAPLTPKLCLCPIW